MGTGGVKKEKCELNDLPRGWEWKRLNEISEINPSINLKHLVDELEVTFLPMRCVEELTGQIDLSLIRKLSEVKKGYTSFLNGDIIFAKITPCMENGKVAIVNGLKNGIGFGSTEFHVIRVHESFSKKFFFFYLIQGNIRKDAQRNMTGSAGQLRVPINYIQKIPLPLPPLDEQHRIVAKIEELFTKLGAGIDSLKKVKAHLKRYRQSVLKYAFEGKLTEEWRKTHDVEPARKLLEQIKEERERHYQQQLKDWQKAIKEWECKGKEDEKPIKPNKPKDIPPFSGDELAELTQLLDGWCWVKIGEVADKITDGEHFRPKTVENGVYFLSAKDIRENVISFKDPLYITKDKAQKALERCNPEKGDILIVSRGATVGRLCTVKTDKVFCLLGSVILINEVILIWLMNLQPLSNGYGIIAMFFEMMA